MNVVPGYRFFECGDCGLQWKEPTRDCHTPSLTSCPRFSGLDSVDHDTNFGEVFPGPGYEEHPEWTPSQIAGPIEVTNATT